MSTRFRVTAHPGDPSLIDKRGDEDAIGREAAALGLVARIPWVPRLVAREPGRMVSTRLPGAPRALSALDAVAAGLLGRRLREIHDLRRSERGWLWWWPRSAVDLDDFRRLRADDAERALAGLSDAGLARRALGAPLPPAPGTHPFRLVHGDLVEANIVWGPDGPGLVDWEFWRLGDPAEDLAYLLELNAVPAAPAAALLDAYGVADMAARVDAWRPLVAADAGAWYLGQGMAAEGARMLDRARR